MNSKERASLRALTRSRFKTLGKELDQRRREIAVALRKQAQDEHADAVKEYNRRLERIKRQQDALASELKELDSEASIAGFERNWRARSEFYQPIDLDQRIGDEMRNLEVEHGSGRLQLERLEQQLLQELLIEDVQSDEAKAFMERIPSVDKLLPMPGRPNKGIKA